MSFFDKFTGGGGDKDKDKKKKPITNPFANVGKALTGGGQKNFSGEGNSLGGTKPGKLLHVELAEQGPLGMKIEKRPNSAGGSIVAMVVQGTQAERAGLQRGDIVCLAGTNGEEEIMYDLFIDMAASPQRPLVFDIRRIQTKSSNSSNTNTNNSTNNSGNGNNTASAEAFARKQAVVAAAEKREKARKALEKPVKRKIEPIANSNVDLNVANVPLSEEARRAVEAAKRGESQLSAQLGYNPYETNKSTAGQARNATATTKHGAVDASGGVAPPLPKVAPPKEAAVADDVPDVSPSFQQAFEACVTTNDYTVVASSFGILRKLVTNATTKQDDKFKRVRLANAKIRAAITDVHGALDIMMACGFVLTEQDGESMLIYNAASEGTTDGPVWLPRALQQMQQYETSGAPTSAV
mmetsp:Transcript_8936/g.14895  ORF Transcript_8936/g.14895 Transcript_8936/m.14895 type:complete len:410 (+) Transcript_8936:266-1495(+)